jgi:hypothetical protein
MARRFAAKAWRSRHIQLVIGRSDGRTCRPLELPGKHPLKDAHAALDAAVLDAYGFAAKADLLKQLLDLNHAVAAREKAGEPVTAPGVPASYGDPSPLISDDCIRPRE